MELRHRRHAFVNRACGLDPKALIANSYATSDTSEGSLVIDPDTFVALPLIEAII